MSFENQSFLKEIEEINKEYDNGFEVTIRIWGGRELCELVTLYILSILFEEYFQGSICYIEMKPFLS